MLIIQGKRTARIKSFTDNQQQCKNCKSFDLRVEVYRDYQHFCLVPVLPFGPNKVKIYCKNCGAAERSESLENYYSGRTGTPVYLYSFFILLSAAIALMVVLNIRKQKEKERFVAHPELNDVYLIRNGSEKTVVSYTFYKVVEKTNDTTRCLRNRYEYLYFPGQFGDRDYFVQNDTVGFSLNDLKDLLVKEKIISVYRIYGREEGFDRVRPFQLKEY